VICGHCGSPHATVDEVRSCAGFSDSSKMGTPTDEAARNEDARGWESPSDGVVWPLRPALENDSKNSSGDGQASEFGCLALMLVPFLAIALMLAWPRLFPPEDPGWVSALKDAGCERGRHWECPSGADLRGADLTGADLGNATMREVDLVGALLYDTDLRRSDLSGAALDGARLDGADLLGAELVGVELGRVDVCVAALVDFAVFLSEDCADGRLRVGAICVDGWRSSSTGTGACSSHRGVYEWILE
jgi:hypothetical protein